MTQSTHGENRTRWRYIRHSCNGSIRLADGVRLGLFTIQWVNNWGFNSRFSTLDPTAMFLLNIGAWAYLVWGFVRWRAPTREHARLSALLRVIVVVLQALGRQRCAFAFLLVLGVVQLLLAVLEFSHRLFERNAKPTREGARSY